MRKLLLVTAVLGTIIVGLAPDAAAAGCGGGFELMAVQDVLRSISSPGATGTVLAGDANRDGLVCVKIVSTAGGTVQIDPALVFDN
jgi:hypothetical protein